MADLIDRISEYAENIIHSELIDKVPCDNYGYDWNNNELWLSVEEDYSIGEMPRPSYLDINEVSTWKDIDGIPKEMEEELLEAGVNLPHIKRRLRRLRRLRIGYNISTR